MIKQLTTTCLATMITMISMAQRTDSTRTLNRGDQNASINATSRTNVPRAQRTAPVQSRFSAQDVIGDKQPDVLLDIPNLSVDEITLEVSNLKANVSLDARVASLVVLKAGVDVGIEQVKLGIKGVQATALLVVRLDNVRAIIEKTLETLDKNPQIVDRLLQTVDNTVGTVGEIANTALQPGGLISQTVNTLGQTVTHTLDATGNIVEKTLDNTGKIVNTKTLGRLLDLPVISETTNAAGQVIKKVRDTSGSVIELTIDKAGKLVSQKLISKGTGSTPTGN